MVKTPLGAQRGIIDTVTTTIIIIILAKDLLIDFFL